MTAQQAFEALLALAARQQGVAARWQLVAAGIAGGILNSLLRRRTLERIGHGVYGVRGLGGVWQAEAVLVLQFGAHAAGSHHTAGRLHDLIRFNGPPTVSVGRGHPRRRPEVALHRVRLATDEVTARHGIPVTTPARTLMDLAACLDSRQFEQALATSLRNDLVSPAAIRALLTRYPRRPGAARLVSMLDGDEPVFTRSEAEELFLSLVRAAGLPAPAVNARVSGYEVDFCWTKYSVVVEIDGMAYHSSRSAQLSDRRRDTALAAVGLRVLRFTWQDLNSRPQRCLTSLVRALARGGF